MFKLYLCKYLYEVSPFVMNWGYLERWKSTAITI